MNIINKLLHFLDREEEFYCEKQLEIVRELQKKNPSFVLVGSLALIIQGINFPVREHDIDIESTNKEEIERAVKNKRWYDSYNRDLYSTHIKDIEVHFFDYTGDSEYKEVEFLGNIYRVKTVENIMDWKLNFTIRGYRKHKSDIDYIFNNAFKSYK